MPRSPSDLSSHLGYWMRAVSNAVSHAFAQRLEGAGITVAEWALMRSLYDRETAPSVLAAKMGLTRGAVTKLADRLIAKGLASRAPDPEDGRAQTLALTPAGRAMVPDLARLADENDAEFFGALRAEDRRVLERILKDMVGRRGITRVPID